MSSRTDPARLATATASTAAPWSSTRSKDARKTGGETLRRRARLRIEERVLGGDRDRLGAGVDLELQHDVPHVGVDGGGLDADLGGHALGPHAVCQQVEDLPLAR